MPTISKTCVLPSGRNFIAELTDAEIDVALERGRLAKQSERRAETVRYDWRNSRIIVNLTDNYTLALSPRPAQRLKAAGDDDLGAVKILGAEYGLQ